MSQESKFCRPGPLLVAALLVAPIAAAALGTVIGATWLAPATIAPDEERLRAVIAREIANNPDAIVAALKSYDARRTAATVIADDLAEAVRDETTAWGFGAEKPARVIAVFNDYNCPYCRRASRELLKAVEQDPALRIVVREFPVITPDSRDVALIALALKPQNLSLAFYRKAEGQAGPVDRDRALAIARALGANMTELDAALAETSTLEAVRTGLDLGAEVGVTGTPTFVIGNELMRGFATADELLERARAHSR